MKHKLIILMAFLFYTQIFPQIFSDIITLKGNGSPSYVVNSDINGDNIDDIVFSNIKDSSFSVYVNITSPGESKFNFTQRIDFQTSGSPMKLAVGDLNLDGLNDIAIIHTTLNEISIWKNTTTIYDTVVSFTAQPSLTTGKIPSAIKINDMNNDGINDIVCTALGDNYAQIFTNTTTPWSDISFSGPKNITTGSGPNNLRLKDFNGDNLPDITTSNIYDKSLSLIIHKQIAANASLEFESPISLGTNLYYDLDITDVDMDGDADIVAASPDSSIYLFINKMGNIVDMSVISTPFRMSSIQMQDISGNGQADYVITSEDDSTLAVMINLTDYSGSPPSFSAVYKVRTNSGPGSCSIADFNRDGNLDIVSANLEGNSLTVINNNILLTSNGIEFVPKDFDSKGPLSDIVAADFNGDGFNEIAVSEWDSTGINVFLNQTSPGSSNSPVFSTSYFYKLKSFGSDVDAADFNMDGRPDLVATNWGDDVSIYLNETKQREVNLVFSPRFDFSTGELSGPNSVSFGDLNMDGKPDIVVGNQFPDINNEYSIAVLINKTDVADSAARFTLYKLLKAVAAPWEVKVEDMNFDKKPDIVVANFDSHSVSVFANSTTAGDTVFNYSGRYEFNAGSMFGTAGLDIGDLNSDRKPDIAFTNQNSDSIGIIINKTVPGSTPDFETARMFPAEYGPFFIKINDVDNDGKPELIVANTAFKNVFSIFANGWYPGEFVPYFGDMVNYPVDSIPVALTVSDLNNDGKPDIATANQNGKSITVNMNNSFLTAIKSEKAESLTPTEYLLEQNYPNPFNPTTKIRYTIPSNNFRNNQLHKVKLKVFNLLGQEIITLVNEWKPSGSYEAEFSTRNSDLASGVYIYTLITDDKVQSRKMILLK